MTYALATIGAALIAGILGWATSRQNSKAQVKAAEITAIAARANAAEVADASKAKANQADLDNLRDWYREAFAELKGRVDAAERRADEAGRRADRASRDRHSAEERAERAETKAAETEKRCDEIERKMELLAPFVASLKAEIVGLGGHPPATPVDLIPPLT